MSTTEAESAVGVEERRLVTDAVDAFVAATAADPPADHRELLRRRFDAGLAWVGNDVGDGGMGVDPALQELVDELLDAAGLIDVGDQRASQRGLFAPILVRYGTPEQRARYLRDLYTEDQIWCLLLSEPDAGSDLASLSTRADRDGDSWMVNGQKVWTSMAHKADFGLLLARADQGESRHRGLVVMIVDMSDPGVSLAPIRQMTGDAEFNQVFMSDVVVPDESRVGDVGAGWGIMMSAIANERFIIGNDVTMKDAGPLGDVLAAWRTCESPNPILRDRVTQMWIEAELMRLYSLQAAHAYRAGAPGAESTILKLRFTHFLRDAYELAMDLMGPRAMLFPDDYEFEMLDEFKMDGYDPRRNFLAARGRTIGGGSSEILRTSLAERVLGLPR